jgi:DNA transformation protein and related proteins
MEDALLSSLPNIGKSLSIKLEQVDILTPRQLLDEGSKQAFFRIRKLDPGACIDMLYALEGAVQGVRWHSLDDTVKKDLKLFYNSIEKTEKDV